MAKSHGQEMAEGSRFAFGKNWARFLRVVDESRITQADESLRNMLGVATLDGKSFLDAGSGSGLFSLAARRLGAKVTSFDFDPQSVACTQEMRKRYSDNAQWHVHEASVLDKKFIHELGKFDVVYSWGVLHHTGSMWEALENVSHCVASGGKLFVAIYNRQPIATPYWTFVKKWYNKLPILKPLIVLIHLVYPAIPVVTIRLLQRRQAPRGMTIWYDLLDWLGGYPFEVAKPEEIFDFYQSRGFQLVKLQTVGGRMGCNELVFEKVQSTSAAAQS